MREFRKLFSIVSCCTVLALGGCEDAIAPPSGDWTVRVTVRIEGTPSSGPIDLTLSAADRTLHAVLPEGTTSYSFTNLPYQNYLATVRKEGYYTVQANSQPGTFDKTLDIGAWLYPVAGAGIRIDSIRCLIQSVVPQVRLQFFPATAGSSQVIVFAGLSPDVSPRLGTYQAAFQAFHGWEYTYNPPAMTDDVYGNFTSAGFRKGMKVYLTARLGQSGIRAWHDEATGLPVYDNLETNTTTVISFIMP